MNITTSVKPEEGGEFSIQAEIIRQIQVSEGQTPCYATSASNQCAKKDCSWRHDCFDEISGR